MPTLHAKRTTFITVFVFVLFFTLTGTTFAGESPKLIHEETITRGAVLQQYAVNTGAGKAKVYVTKINLKDPYIKLDVIYGAKGKLGKNQTVDKLADEYGAIAAINGDFFDMTSGSTLGPIMSDNSWITTPSGIEGLSGFGVTKDAEPQILPFTFYGFITAMNGQSFPIAQINKTISLADKINIFDHSWNLDNWPVNSLGSYTCAVVDDDEVEEILENTKPEEIPEDGYVILGQGAGARFIQENIQAGEDVELDYQIEPSSDWDFVMGAHTPLVSNGVRVTFTRNIPGYHARTAVGYSKDKSYVFWFSVENSNDSSGMTLEELADFMIQLGVDQGVNLDGGGSTTLVSRHPGETNLSLITVPEATNLRPVPDGLGLFSTAPQGSLKDFIVAAPSFLLINENTFLNLKAIDEYDNPLSVDAQNAIWTTNSDAVTLVGNQIMGRKAGSAPIEVKSEQVKKEFLLEIAGRDQISSLSLGQASLLLNPGDKAFLQPVLTTKSGLTRQVPADLFSWEWIGVKGSIQANGEVVAGDTAGAGWLVGTYDRFSSMVPVQIGTASQILMDFENKPDLNFLGTPQEVTGQFTTSQSDKIDGLFSGELRYDFSLATADVQAAYGQFGAKGVSFSGLAKGMDLWVKGDDSNYWLRAEIQDQNGQIQYVTLADKINWSGWKQLCVDFPLAIDKPTLKRVYVVNLKSSSAGKPDQGTILLDKIAFRTSQPLPEDKNVILNLFVNKKEMLVNGQEQKIDQGPIVEKGRSYIPARYILEALGGKVFWDGQEKKVRVLLGEHMIDLWVNDQNHTIVNGVNRPSDTAPIIRSNRTLIPVRMVTENLGYKVDWVNGKITISKK
ncbi:phosphodiester glycosidase family protein [Candidatus Formimonas warabiya]|uniref:Copper amine oxidase n=1 Tax=Formimonas warabiya TaxID=1761012 RepID=A0A3G1KPC2_FORW1|nr:stalk domain-containing protein [Candidatus Formimonas warabiya]ATW24314.1 hypothetical protein DCMF_05490 [Candidatus Formimonas warabiya]